MANVFAIHSVGESLRTYLDTAYPRALRQAHPCTFRLLSGGTLAGHEEMDNTLSLYLYRVTMNEHLRNTKRALEPDQEETPLSVDLHYLLTVWAKSALAEHLILAWTMRQLQQHPVFDGSSLSPEAEWGSGEFIQVIPAELSTENLMRIWDALEPPYRLSVSYIARVVRIDTDPSLAGSPVVAKRFVVSDRVEVP